MGCFLPLWSAGFRCQITTTTIIIIINVPLSLVAMLIPSVRASRAPRKSPKKMNSEKTIRRGDEDKIAVLRSSIRQQTIQWTDWRDSITPEEYSTRRVTDFSYCVMASENFLSDFNTNEMRPHKTTAQAEKVMTLRIFPSSMRSWAHISIWESLV